MEFVQFDEAWRLLRPVGVEEATRSATELRLALAEHPNSTCVDIAATDHPMAQRLPADLPKIDRKKLGEVVESIIHKLHLTGVYVIPVGHWRQLFDAVAGGMASNAKWRAIDAAAIIELNTRDALLFQPADFHILRELVQVVLIGGTHTTHGISIATTGSPLLIEVMPVGEVVVYTGSAPLAQLVRELINQVRAVQGSQTPGHTPPKCTLKPAN